MAQSPPDLFRVTLLGTGAPPPVLNRFGPSTLVEAGHQKLISMPAAAPCSAFISSAFRSPTSAECF